MKFLKILCAIGFLVVLVSNIWSISGWIEARGVYDDICYLRQAHLFERFGLGGIDTNIAFDDDHYLKNKMKEIGYPEWNDPKRMPCHTLTPSADKYVLQYPPGTGFVLSLFPAGFQVIPLYVLTSVVAVGFLLLALTYASTLYRLMLVAAFGDCAIYLMINPTKASYSVAPTMIVCAMAGFLTAKAFMDWPRHRLFLLALIGLLLGLSVNFRLPNLFLAAGYCLYLAGAFLLARSRETFLQGLSFGTALLIGMAPTLIANAINAGGPFSTTYGSVDVVPPELNSEIVWRYVVDVQFILLTIAAVWTGLLWYFNRTRAGWVTVLVAINLAVNLIFFMTHPIFTPYYIIPIDMLSLWTLLFATLDLRADKSTFPKPANA
ncbi:hypothetical protein [Bradyrhizobium valentinum]|uniref:Glycosyltransferase RgtA/B/C/D-like domain-containing protein n=1 Tax=Bradyrhizobium valentinum TaxID=1518501 RepID=A0A0R3LLD2_9BRAD|nr:hypothetical protein [Bradyrhizobium valentinum]KRR08524.1 hypothetical protein CP49_24880 [Bradyrhizobium valentinum]